MRNHNAPAAKRAGITKHINWHVFRHRFSTLLAENDEDVKTVQSLMRHANCNITMNRWTHAVSSKKRRAQSRVAEMITAMPFEETLRTRRNWLWVYRSCTPSFDPKLSNKVMRCWERSANVAG